VEMNKFSDHLMSLCPNHQSAPSDLLLGDQSGWAPPAALFGPTAAFVLRLGFYCSKSVTEHSRETTPCSFLWGVENPEEHLRLQESPTS
jgi:hypothetical protein